MNSVRVSFPFLYVLNNNIPLFSYEEMHGTEHQHLNVHNCMVRLGDNKDADDKQLLLLTMFGTEDGYFTLELMYGSPMPHQNEN